MARTFFPRLSAPATARTSAGSLSSPANTNATGLAGPLTTTRPAVANACVPVLMASATSPAALFAHLVSVNDE